MTTPSRSQAWISDLAVHSGWLKRLARELARGDADADDLIQDAYVTALRLERHAPDRPAPWFRGLLANLARRRRRTEARLQHREKKASSPGALPAPDEVAERLDLQKMLLSHVQELREPYRTVVYLRFYEELEPSEIAEREGAPAATVRSQLMRGLEQLRARLDADHGGDRAAWCAAFAPMIGTAAGGAVAIPGAAVGIFAMNAGLKWAAAALVLGTLAVGGYWIIDSGAEKAGTSAARAPAAKAALDEARSINAADAIATSGGKEAPRAVQADSAPVSAAKPAPEAAETEAMVEATLVDADRVPIAGAELRAHGKVVATSSADGSVRAKLKITGPLMKESVEAAAPGKASSFAEAVLREGKTTNLGTLILDHPCVVAGRVLDESGAPVGGAEVWVTDKVESDSVRAGLIGPQITPPGAPGAKTDAFGSFRISNIAPGVRRVWAHAADKLWVSSDPLEARPTPPVEGVELKLRPLPAESRIEGVVLDPDGKPVPRAPLRISYASTFGSSSNGAIADDRGRFRVWVFAPVPHSIVAGDPDHKYSDAGAEKVAPGTLDLELRLTPARRFLLAVRDADDKPVYDLKAEVWTQPAKNVYNVTDSVVREEGSKEPVRLRVPATPFYVRVQASGFAEALTETFRPDAVGDTVTVRLLPQRGIRGRVVRKDGAPVPGAKLILTRKADRTTVVEVNGYPCDLEQNDPIASATSKSNGAFALDVSRAEDSCVLLAEADGFARSSVELPAFHPDRGLTDVQVVMSQGGAIEGAVLGPVADAAGVIVAVSRHDGHPQTQRVGADGRYRFDRLTPGRWNVEITERELDPGSRSISVNTQQKPRKELPTVCEVIDGSVTRYDFDLKRLAPCVLRGELRIDGARAAGTVVVLRSAGAMAQESLVETVTDADGRFTLSRRQPGAVTLALTPSGVETLEIAYDVELVRGEQAWSQDLHFGGVEGAGPKPTPEHKRQWLLRASIADGGLARAFAASDADGKFIFPKFPAGAAVLESIEYSSASLVTKAAGPGESNTSVSTSTTEVAKVAVQPNATATVTVR